MWGGWEGGLQGYTAILLIAVPNYNTTLRHARTQRQRISQADLHESLAPTMETKLGP